MPKNLIKLFDYLEEPEITSGLFEKIISRLDQERKLTKIKFRLAVFGSFLIGSIIAFVPIFNLTRFALIKSGFIQFFSLLFSDTKIVLTYWENFAMSLLETLPVMNLIILLAIILVFLESLKLLLKDLKNIFISKQFLNN